MINKTPKLKFLCRGASLPQDDVDGSRDVGHVDQAVTIHIGMIAIVFIGFYSFHAANLIKNLRPQANREEKEIWDLILVLRSWRNGIAPRA